ncbi:MAG TPA: ribonuclease HII [Caldilineaceae bacterium]|nr:ribonuclease HII [Caldilineaceae bacterium]
MKAEVIITVSSQTSKPTLMEERKLWRAGYCHVAGIDEAGRGALAGPVVAAAVIVPPQSEQSGVWAHVDDSKRLTPERRCRFAAAIQEEALAWGIGAVDAAQIDEIGIAPATKQAMMAAIAALTVRADFLLIDWVRLALCPIEQQSFTKADQRIVSVAAASILAKVHRDALLTALHEQYPEYGFPEHKGYGTARHCAAIARYGPCSVHRHSFAPIAQKATLF